MARSILWAADGVVVQEGCRTWTTTLDASPYRARASRPPRTAVVASLHLLCVLGTPPGQGVNILKESRFDDQHSPIATRQFGTSLCISVSNNRYRRTDTRIGDLWR